MPMNLLSAFTVVLASLMPSLSRAAPGPIATAKFDFQGDYTWSSFPAVPSEKTGWPEGVTNRSYPWMHVKTPQTRRICVWRDIGKSRFGSDPSIQPDSILLSCTFGPKTSIEAPETLEGMLRDYLNVQIVWIWRDARYVLSRVNVDLSVNGVWYISHNAERDIPQIKLETDTVEFPSSHNNPIPFALQVALSARLNSGEPQESPVLHFAFTGTAEPIPDWVNY